mmetsp:Transcript_17534/g.43736  ORF Transcript_17534/g.43736 Transcript_17534/m.43736 type:complete len:82 (+) Transcript_17534:186-431(+)
MSRNTEYKLLYTWSVILSSTAIALQKLQGGKHRFSPFIPLSATCVPHATVDLSTFGVDGNYTAAVFASVGSSSIGRPASTC